MFKRSVWLVICLATALAASAGPSAAGEPQVLALIGAGDTEALKTLAHQGAEIYFQSDRWLLAGMGEAQLAAFPATVQVLDRTPWSDGALYYWVIVRGRERIRLEEAAGVQVLLQEEGRALIKAAPADAERLPQMGYEIQRVNRAPKPLAAAAAEALPLGSRDFGGVIDDIVAAVSQTQYTSDLQTLVNFGTRYTYAAGVDNAANWLYNQFQGFGLAVERHYYPISSYSKQNIIATKTGLLYPNEVVFITAHYDCTSESPSSSAPGADDNGSGTAAVVEAARILSQYTFARTIKFACFSGEEQGLVGSGDYVADIAAQGMNVVGCFNFDMIAWSGSDPLPRDLIIYTDSASAALAYELEDAVLYYLPTALDPVVVVEALEASDHASFWAHGYDAICAIEEEAWGSDFNPYYHTTSDTMAHCDLVYATNVTKAALAAVADWATPYTPTGLRVTPLESFISGGPVGGPFTPASKGYTLINNEAYPITYTATESAPWLNLSSTGGTIPASSSVLVSMSITSYADTMSTGTYTATVDFVNTTNHDGDTSRTAELTVGLPEVQYSWNLSSSPGWTISGGQWAFGVPTGGGGQYGNNDPTSGHTGSSVYGYNLSGDYANNIPEYHLTSTAIDCSLLSQVSVKFWRWLNVETSTYDHAYVRVSNNGSSWTTVWQNSGEITDSAWSQVSYDISAVADGQPTVYLRWTMGTTDTAWQYSGWNLDDIEIWGVEQSSEPTDTVAAELDCVPGSGVLPFSVNFTARLINLLPGESRRAAGRIDIDTGGGQFFSNWRSGWTTLAAGQTFSTSWVQSLPSLGSLVGTNLFTLYSMDVTPSPYNQPPYAAAGDTDSQPCTVTASAP